MNAPKNLGETTRENIALAIAEAPEDYRMGCPLLGRLFEYNGAVHVALNGTTALNISTTEPLFFDECELGSVNGVEFPASEMAVDLETRIRRMVFVAKLGMDAKKLLSSVTGMTLMEPNVFDKCPDATTLADVLTTMDAGLGRIVINQMAAMVGVGDARAKLMLKAAAAKLEMTVGHPLFQIAKVTLH
ncbi:hypothetical protein MQM1_066 [Aeromonas phage vB_AsaP_MQM1]|nr:hypothetical protein MQM1_066 [Aeromonas phage vB_AsaP_MQM1]